MKLRIKSIRGITMNYNRAFLELEVDANMTEGQMLDAILSFLEQVPGERWKEWKQIIDGDSRNAA